MPHLVERWCSRRNRMSGLIIVQLQNFEHQRDSKRIQHECMVAMWQLFFFFLHASVLKNKLLGWFGWKWWHHPALWEFMLWSFWFGTVSSIDWKTALSDGMWFARNETICFCFASLEWSHVWLRKSHVLFVVSTGPVKACCWPQKGSFWTFEGCWPCAWLLGPDPLCSKQMTCPCSCIIVPNVLCRWHVDFNKPVFDCNPFADNMLVDDTFLSHFNMQFTSSNLTHFVFKIAPRKDAFHSHKAAALWQPQHRRTTCNCWLFYAETVHQENYKNWKLLCLKRAQILQSQTLSVCIDATWNRNEAFLTTATTFVGHDTACL